MAATICNGLQWSCSDRYTAQVTGRIVLAISRLGLGDYMYSELRPSNVLACCFSSSRTPRSESVQSFLEIVRDRLSETRTRVFTPPLLHHHLSHYYHHYYPLDLARQVPRHPPQTRLCSCAICIVRTPSFSTALPPLPSLSPSFPPPLVLSLWDDNCDSCRHN
jgi:hypothetical protein